MSRRAIFPLAVVATLAACHDPRPDDAVCRCVPGNQSRVKQADGSAFDAAALLARLRRHQRDVAQHRNPRDIKLGDDELRFAIATFCQPCGAWVGDRATMEELFPLRRLDDAAGAVCLGLILHDGTTVYGDARPRACR
jgi:hypothetical protein